MRNSIDTSAPPWGSTVETRYNAPHLVGNGTGSSSGRHPARILVSSPARGPRLHGPQAGPLNIEWRASPDLLQELLDPIDPLVDLLHARREAQADVGVEPAVVAGNHRDVALFQQRGSE